MKERIGKMTLGVTKFEMKGTRENLVEGAVH